jgi:hypothetical protein
MYVSLWQNLALQCMTGITGFGLRMLKARGVATCDASSRSVNDRYVAPEVVDGSYTKEGDVYAYAMILYEVGSTDS